MWPEPEWRSLFVGHSPGRARSPAFKVHQELQDSRVRRHLLPTDQHPHHALSSRLTLAAAAGTDANPICVEHLDQVGRGPGLRGAHRAAISRHSARPRHGELAVG